MANIRKAIEIPMIAKVDAENRIVYGVVYKASKVFDEKGAPVDFEDTQGNWAKVEEVKKACHSFNKKLQNRKVPFKGGVDKQHDCVAGYGIVVESYIAKADETEINAAIGDWVAAVISIHSPWVGRDQGLLLNLRRSFHFNPLSLGRERPTLQPLAHFQYYFNPLSLCRERHMDLEFRHFPCNFNPLSLCRERHGATR